MKAFHEPCLTGVPKNIQDQKQFIANCFITYSYTPTGVNTIKKNE